MDPDLIKAVIMAESGYNHMAISKKGAIGLMQLMPATATDLGVEDPFNPKHNVIAMYFSQIRPYNQVDDVLRKYFNLAQQAIVE